MNPLHTVILFHQGLISRIRNLFYRSLGVRMDGYIWMRRISIPRQWNDITVEKEVSLDEGVVLLCSGPAAPNKMIIRQGTYINRNCMLDAHEHLEIGRNCMIGPNCYLTDGNHGMALNKLIKDQPVEHHPVIIEDNVWLGAGVIILSGVRIGQGAVIGAGAVVTKEVRPNSIVVGVPGRSIGFRKPSKV